MLTPVRQLTYVIVLCDDIGRMKAFYRDLLPFAVDSESDTSLSLRAGGVQLGLRQRTRQYDGVGARQESPGIQLAFRVEPEQVDQCHELLIARCDHPGAAHRSAAGAPHGVLRRSRR
jgi:catechol-2,3-dioxygenase